MIVDESRRRRYSAVDAALAMDWDDIISGVAADLGAPCPVSAEQLVREHAAPPYTRLLDEADQVLAQISAQGWRIIAATHGLSKYQRPVLAALGILPLFQGIHSPDSQMCFKQQRDFWLPHLDQATTCVHVGDLWDDDVAAPGRFGILTVWKKSLTDEEWALLPAERARLLASAAGDGATCDAIIGDLQELPPVLARLCRA